MLLNACLGVARESDYNSLASEVERVVLNTLAMLETQVERVVPNALADELRLCRLISGAFGGTLRHRLQPPPPRLRRAKGEADPP
jgi:hypothetical protein